jgi:hypothetical protein
VAREALWHVGDLELDADLARVAGVVRRDRGQVGERAFRAVLDQLARAQSRELEGSV